MKPVTTVIGRMVPLDRADVDTDQLMPARYLKRIERTGFGAFLLEDLRAADPDFVLNDPRYAGATILVSGPNFGSGSSREHAPWGLQQYGFEVVIAPSFADIFRSNCAKIGLLCVTLPEKVCRELAEMAAADPEVVCTVDLPEQTVAAGEIREDFTFDPHTKHMLIGGLDVIAMTLQLEGDITAFEAARPPFMPVTSGR